MEEDQATNEIVRPRLVIGGDFSLIDDRGRAVTNTTYLGRHALIFFGFTHCKMVCPEALARISVALDLLGRLADRVQPLYISVDPARDTPQVMRTFLAERFPRFTGLTGDKEKIDAVKRAYKVYAEREEADAEGNYDVPHTAMIFVVGPDGGFVTHFPDSSTADEIASGLRAVLDGAEVQLP